MNSKAKTSTLTLVECALMISIATVLSLVKLFDAPQGGSITCASMVPIVLISFRHGNKWGLLSGFVFALLQMLTGGTIVPVTPSFWGYVLVVLLDYILAFTFIGSAAFFGKLFKNRALSVGFGALMVCILRFLSSFASGIINWGAYAGDVPVWLYSLLYNGGYMLFEGIITVVVSVALVAVMDRVLKKTPAAA